MYPRDKQLPATPAGARARKATGPFIGGYTCATTPRGGRLRLLAIDQAAQCGLLVNLPSACGSKPIARAPSPRPSKNWTAPIYLESRRVLSRACGPRAHTHLHACTHRHPCSARLSRTLGWMALKCSPWRHCATTHARLCRSGEACTAGEQGEKWRQPAHGDGIPGSVSLFHRGASCLAVSDTGVTFAVICKYNRVEFAKFVRPGASRSASCTSASSNARTLDSFHIPSFRQAGLASIPRMLFTASSFAAVALLSASAVSAQSIPAAADATQLATVSAQYANSGLNETG